MIPFKEMLNPVTGFKDRIPWSTDKANVKLRTMRQAHKDRLNAEDCDHARRSGIEHLIDESTGMLRTLELVETGGNSRDGDEGTVGTNSQYAINPVASRIKHSGAMLNDAFIPEWRAFCSKPQNDDNVEYPMPVYVPKERSKRASVVSARGQGDVAEVGGVQTPIVRPEYQKRGPGRPRRGFAGAV